MAQVIEQGADEGYAGGVLCHFVAFEWLHWFQRWFSGTGATLLP